MSDLVLSGVRIASAEADAVWDVGISAGVIDRVGTASETDGGEVRDCSGLTLFPGFIDIHNHGAVGVDVNEADVDGLIAIGEYLATQGVTAWVPTLVPDSDEVYRRVIEAIDGLMEIQSGRAIAQAVGVHYEGVFANEKMCGALRPEFFKVFHSAGGGLDDALKAGTTKNTKSTKIYGNTASGISLPRLKDGVHMTTFAPEIENGIELAVELKKENWIACIGHTKADTERLDRAAAAGAKHVTHFFNAMTGIHHRDVGVAGWALTNPEVTFDIIADGIHVAPRMVEMACRVKTPDKSILISDSVAPTGLGDGEYELWGEKVTVENKRTRNERGSIAGSVISMFDAVNGVRSIGFSPAAVAKMSSANPARLLGLEASRGSVETGKRADLVAVDAEGSIAFVLIGGRVAYQA
ncbi:MAG TPA: N-acetylglucosamine-6-phosphate deacetylase [Pyrinomonadaceae bacterium]